MASDAESCSASVGSGKSKLESVQHHTRERLSEPGLALLSQTSHAVLIIPPPRAKEKSGAGVSLEKVQESLRIPSKADRNYFSPEVNE